MGLPQVSWFMQTPQGLTLLGRLWFFQENHMIIAPHSAYSPDLEPSEFFLLEPVKRALEGAEFAPEERFWPRFNQFYLSPRPTFERRFSPNGLSGWTGLPWTKVINIDNLNNVIFNFVVFSSQAVVLRFRGTPDKTSMFLALGRDS
jgi:hypothetical protein